MRDAELLIREYDYELPSELIAQTPIEPRDAARLMVIHRDTGEIEHRIFRDIVEYLRPGDVLVANDSRVIPARLHARKIPTGGRVELLLLNRRDATTWEVLVGGKRVREGTRLEVHRLERPSEGAEKPSGASGQGEAKGLTLSAEVIEVLDGPRRVVRFERPVEEVWDELGEVPLPPYIREPLRDPERYQTVYARVEGSAAAPTAGLHFTAELMHRLREMGVEFAWVTLHIGLDTFQPVREERVTEHKMHSEYCELNPQTAEQINRAKLEGRRVIAVGTTAVRVLETAALKAVEIAGDGCPWQTVAAFSGYTDLFIYPGFRFRVVDALITNFHLPRSTLLLLVSAFAGRELILRAYREAVRRRYRFYSFGDATLIL
jgi:S-adenosylmethionine:tRNA ribosyltransferase-isomerase